MKSKLLIIVFVLALLTSAVSGTVQTVKVANADSRVTDEVTTVVALSTDTPGLALLDWPMFHNNPSGSGCPDNIAPVSNDLLWTFKANSSVSSSPAVVEDVVYIGSDDGSIYALN